MAGTRHVQDMAALLKFSWVKFSRFIKYPRKPRNLYSSKISSYTVILVACLFVVRYELYSIELAMFYNRI